METKTKSRTLAESLTDPLVFIVLFVTGLIGIALLALFVIWAGERMTGVRVRPSPSFSIECMAHPGHRILIDTRTDRVLRQCAECGG